MKAEKTKRHSENMKKQIRKEENMYPTIEMRWLIHKSGERILQYRQEYPDWSGHNEDPEFRFGEWEDVPICPAIPER